MILRYSPTSPYVRKVNVAAWELGLWDALTWKQTDPWDPADDLPHDNPLGKVPALVLEDGETLIDSTAILDYLDTRHDGEKLIPENGARRIWALKMYAIGDGMLDAAVTRLIERVRRPKELYWADWDARQRDKIGRALDWLEPRAEELETRLTTGQIAVACALGYIDFRFPDEHWRQSRPGLAAWYGAFAERPAMAATRPPA